MKKFLIAITFIAILTACDKKPQQKEEFAFDKPKVEAVDANKPSKRIDLVSKGIGPITEVELQETIDEELAAEGQAIYQQNCTACHQIGTTFIGPPPNGILKRRTPEWVMNMILNTDQMLKQDSLAKDLFMEFNGTVMTSMGLSAADARAVLEYFRTLE